MHGAYGRGGGQGGGDSLLQRLPKPLAREWQTLVSLTVSRKASVQLSFRDIVSKKKNDEINSHWLKTVTS